MIPIVIGLTFVLSVIILGAVSIVAALGALKWVADIAEPRAQRLARWLRRRARSHSLRARAGHAH